jgi:hypothetical protein
MDMPFLSHLEKCFQRKVSNHHLTRRETRIQTNGFPDYETYYYKEFAKGSGYSEPQRKTA